MPASQQMKPRPDSRLAVRENPSAYSLFAGFINYWRMIYLNVAASTRVDWTAICS